MTAAAPPPGAPPRLMPSNATYRSRANTLKHPDRLNVRSGSVAGPLSTRGLRKAPQLRQLIL